MKKILVTGAAGQIGSELVPALRNRYGNDNVIAAWSGRTPLPEYIRETGPFTSVDVTDYEKLSRTIGEHEIGIIYHMSSILSANAERNRRQAFNVNYLGLFNVFEASLSNKVERVIVPSSIAALGPFNSETPRQNTLNDTRQRPRTMYGMAKVNGEMWADYYSEHEDTDTRLDIRGVRFPGLLTWKTEPNTAGTTDYANAMIFDAVRRGRYDGCPLPENARLPMMYMNDAIDVLIVLSETPRSQLTHHGDYNVGAYDFTPRELVEVIKDVCPKFGINNFEMSCQIDSVRERIAKSWPESLDYSVVKRDLRWEPKWSLQATVEDMIKNLQRLQKVKQV